MASQEEHAYRELISQHATPTRGCSSRSAAHQSKLPDYVRLVLGLAPSSLNQLDADLVSVHRQRAQRAEPPAGPPVALLVEQPLAETPVEAPAEPPVGQRAEPQGEGAGASETCVYQARVRPYPPPLAR